MLIQCYNIIIMHMTPMRIFIAFIVSFIAIAAVAYAFHKNATAEAFRARHRTPPLFNGSYPRAPIVCLAGDKQIPCTAFSSA